MSIQKKISTLRIYRFKFMKQDYFSANNIKYIDYKDIEILKKFINPNGKIMSHKRTGVTAKNQRALTSAIKHGRFLGLLPFVVK